MFVRSMFASVLLAASGALMAQSSATPTSVLGFLVDSSSARRAHDGLSVLGATPGSVADRLGLRPGDIVVDVNGTSLANLGADADGRALAAATFNSSVASLPAAAPLRLRVLRNGVAMTMNASIHEAALLDQSAVLAANSNPAAEAPDACGRISIFDVAPRSKHLYRAKILLLDGATPGPSGTPSFRVSAGTHHLLVAEDIPTDEMGVGSFATLRSRRDTSKQLTVTVKPNTTAMLAARLNTDRAADFAHAAYWDPVVWREIPQRCP